MSTENLERAEEIERKGNRRSVNKAAKARQEELVQGWNAHDQKEAEEIQKNRRASLKQQKAEEERIKPINLHILIQRE